MMIQDQFFNLSNNELLSLLDKYSKDYEEVFQEIFKRQNAGKMERFPSEGDFLKEYAKVIKKAS